MKLLLSFILMLGLSTAQECSENCYCKEDQAECSLTSCSLLELETGYGSLIIHGELCPEQRSFLEGITDVTFISLMDDYCGDIPNCRQVFFNCRVKSYLQVTYLQVTYF